MINGSLAERVRSEFRRFSADTTGQDLIEYALLTAFVGVAGAAAFGLLASTLGLAYGSWDAGSQGLWVPPNPQ
jgi:Flp pilus assembly pilin Flp